MRGCRRRQSVKRAVGRNPILVLILCHRVVGTNGSLAGYAGRIDKKCGSYHMKKQRCKDMQEFKKVIVIGSPGAGKSTFARKLRDCSGLPLYYLDMVWHKPDQTNISREEFDRKLGELLEKEKWIIDGNYLRTLEIRLDACDTVFLLDFPLEICLSGVQSRIGQKREDLPWIESGFDSEFRQWILDFPQAQLPCIYELLEKYRKTKDIVIFRSREEADAYIRRVKAFEIANYLIENELEK